MRFVAALVFASLGASAQPAGPAFEVVSIRPHVAIAPQNGKAIAGMSLNFSGPRVSVNGATLRSLVNFAYDLKAYESSDQGWPKWASEQFDILAKAEGEDALTRDRARLFFRALLSDQFKLKFHYATKDVSGYMLNVAKAGPKLTPSDPDAKGYMTMTGTNYAEMKAVNFTMGQLATQLLGVVHEPVFDGTGLTGGYDFTLSWSENNPAYPTFFTAVQEQLGLKLEKHKGPIQMFVVDSAEKPPLE